MNENYLMQLLIKIEKHIATIANCMVWIAVISFFVGLSSCNTPGDITVHVAPKTNSAIK